MVDWNYYDKFDSIIRQYMPNSGEGNTVASQVVTAVNKLVYKWYNDGDVFDNTHHLAGWWNDLSSYANWLHKNTHASPILEGISDCLTYSDYDDLLKDLADTLLNEKYLKALDKQAKDGSIYECDGIFRYVEPDEDDEDDYDDEDYDEEY
jgi:hypothetical protein